MNRRKSQLKPRIRPYESFISVFIPISPKNRPFLKSREYIPPSMCLSCNMFQVSIKWNKQVLGPIAFTPTDTIQALKGLVQPLTKVPVEKQKLLYKGRILKNTETPSDIGIESDSQLVLVGAAESSFASLQPVSSLGLPTLSDLGNSSHLNSTVQLLRCIPEIAESLQSYQGSDLPKYLKDVLLAMTESRGQSVSPVQLLAKVLSVMPQFGQREASGRLKRPDFAEFSMAFCQSALNLIPVIGEDGKERGLYRELFEFQLEKQGKREAVWRLTAQMGGRERLEEGLQAALYRGEETWEVGTLPAYVWVHVVADRNGKVHFQKTLDVLPLCTPALQAELNSTRASSPPPAQGLDQVPPTGHYRLLGLCSVQSLSIGSDQYVVWLPYENAWVGLADSKAYRVETVEDVIPVVLLYSRGSPEP